MNEQEEDELKLKVTNRKQVWRLVHMGFTWSENVRKERRTIKQFKLTGGKNHKDRERKTLAVSVSRLEKHAPEEPKSKEQNWNQKPLLCHLKNENIKSKSSSPSHLHSFRLHPSPLPKPISPSSLYTARACRHFIAATGDMGGDGCRQCVLGGGDGRRNETEVEGWREITRVWRASLSLHQCQALRAALRYYQEVISSPWLSVYQSLCLSPSFLLTEMKESLFFSLWLCASVLVSLALCNGLIFSLCCHLRALQSATLKIKQEINMSPVLPVPFAWNNYT